MQIQQNGAAAAGQSAADDNQDPTIRLNAAFAKNQVAGEGTGGGQVNGGQGSTQAADDNQDDTPQEVLEQLETAAGKNKFENQAYGWQKRIGKLTAQKKQALAEIDELKRQIDELKSKKPQKPADPVDALVSQEEIDAYAAQVAEERQSALRLLASTDDSFEVGGATYSRDDILRYVDSLDAVLQQRLPARSKALRDKSFIEAKSAEMQRQAEQAFDWYADKDSAGRKWVDEQLADPELTANLRVLLAYAYEGLTVNGIRKKYAANGKGATAAKSVPASAHAPAGGGAGKNNQSPKYYNADGSINVDLARNHIFD